MFLKRLMLFIVVVALPSGACSAQNMGAANTLPKSNQFKGPIPWADISAFGARAVTSAFSTTAACDGTNTITLNSASLFENGDGITISGCGATNSMPTPSAPTVIPSAMGYLPGTEVVVNSPAGTSTYQYQIVAIDRFGGHTAASPVTTIQDGQSSLGLQNVSVSNALLSNDRLTVNTSEFNLLVPGALVRFYNSTTPKLSGFYNVATTPSKTLFTVQRMPQDSRALGWKYDDSVSSTGGSIQYFLSNHIVIRRVIGAWAYCIYALRPGDRAMHYIGRTQPTGYRNGYLDLAFDDLGSPFNDNQSLGGCPSMPSVLAQNDQLTTTIISGAATKYIKVANAASQKTGGQLAIFDDGPGLVATAKSIATNGIFGLVYVPPNGGSGSPRFFIESDTQLPPNTMIEQAGLIEVDGTGMIEVPSEVSWNGNKSQSSAQAFAINTGAGISGNASPLIYLPSSGGVRFEGLNLGGTWTNGGTAVLADTSAYVTFDHITFAGGNISDYYSMPLVVRDTSQTEDNYYMHSVSIVGGAQTAISWTPLLYFAEGQNGSGGNGLSEYYVDIQDSFFSHRGIALNNIAGGSEKISISYSGRQGGISPFVAIYGNSSVFLEVRNLNLDTEVMPVLATFNDARSFFSLWNYSGGSVEASGGPPPSVSGVRNDLGSLNYGFGNIPVAGRDSFNCFGDGAISSAPYFTLQPGSGQICINNSPFMFGAGTSLFWPIGLPSKVSVRVGVGGSLALGESYQYAVTAVGPDGGESTTSVPSPACTPLAGKQTCIVSWTNPLGSVMSKVYRCTSGCTTRNGNSGVASGNWRAVAPGVNGSSLSDKGLGLGNGPPDITGTGKTVVNSDLVSTPLFDAPETTAPSGVRGFDQLYADSNEHRWKMINNAGTPLSIAGILSGATKVIGGSPLSVGQCASDIVLIAGATRNMTVVVSPNTYPGDGMIPWGYVSTDGTVVVKVCAQANGTPIRSTYNVRVIQ